MSHHHGWPEETRYAGPPKVKSGCHCPGPPIVIVGFREENQCDYIEVFVR